MAVSDIFPALFDNYFIKVIFLVHSFLIFLSSIANNSFSSTIIYTSYNSIFLVTILLSILVDKNTDIVLVSTAYNVICAVLDIVLLIAGSSFGFPATLFTVINLVARPISTILLLRNYSARAGVDDPTSGLLEVNIQPPRARSAYQNIEEPNQSVP